MSDRIRLGLIGAGIFARDAHVPALHALKDNFDVVAVFSRTEESASSLADLFDPRPDILTNMDDLLAREDIEAVDILLPITLLPSAVEAALAAGKHVLSEKPVAPSVADGEILMENTAQYSDLVWMVAENWRYEDSFVKAKELIEYGEIGEPILFHWAMHIPLNPDNKYYHTAWRRDNLYQGGYILDGGVHHMAGLRLMLGEVYTVSAIASQYNPNLPPVDTLTANLQLDSGVIGSYVVTYSATAPWKPSLYVVGSHGTLGIEHHRIEINRTDTTREVEITSQPSIQAELADFANVIRSGGTHRSSPWQALQDVAIIEAMLESARTGQQVEVKRVV